MIEIGTLVILGSRAVMYPMDTLRAEPIEQDEDRPLGLVTGLDENRIHVKWIKGNAWLGYFTGSTDRVFDWQLEIIA